jgi:hypothetical protein
MIDSEFIIQYTNALYSTPMEYAPRYDEFRDMFSSGQIRSKEWLIEKMSQYLDIHEHEILIAGAWYGTLGMMLHKKFPYAYINMLDIDPRCEKFVDNIIYETPDIKYITEDMFFYEYSEDIIINTSCEHINLIDWLKLIPKGKTVVLQSNNYKEGNGHINCVNSAQDFYNSIDLNRVFYCDELQMPMYTRYMIIGEV